MNFFLKIYKIIFNNFFKSFELLKNERFFLNIYLNV